MQAIDVHNQTRKNDLSSLKVAETSTNTQHVDKVTTGAGSVEPTQ